MGRPLRGRQPQVVAGLRPAAVGPKGICLYFATIGPHPPNTKRGPTQFTFMPSFRDRYGIKSFSGKTEL